MRYIILLFLLKTTEALAQAHGSDSQSNLQDLASGGAMFRSFDNRFKGIVGFPTLFEQYVPGKVTLVSGKAMNYPKMNYDLVNGDLLVIRNGVEMVLNRQAVMSFTIESIEYRKIRVPSVDMFAQIVVDGKSQLFRKQEKVIKEPTNSGTYSPGKTYSEFENVITYLWIAPDGSSFEIKNKKKLLSDVKISCNIDLEPFVKKNNLNIKDQAHLELIFDQLNDLL